MSKKQQRKLKFSVDSIEKVEKPSAVGICLICGSKMLLVSTNPDVWYCSKCGAKRVTEAKQ